MNIGIDGRLLAGRMTGINRYLRNIVKYLPEYDKNNSYTLFAPKEMACSDDFYNIVHVNKNKLPKQIYGHYWLNFILPQLLIKHKVDIFFTPYILVPFKKGNYKNIIVIHDSMPKVCKQYYSFHYKKYLQFVLPHSIIRSDLIITVSDSAMQDIIKYNNVKQEKIRYVHLWTTNKYKPRTLSNVEVKNIRSKYSLPKKFLLYVGAIEERKNIEGILKISDKLTRKGVQLPVVLIGNEGFGFKKIYNKIKKRENRIKYLRYVAEEDLPLIYNLARIFLFPSHYEGFGLPPLEAMKSGVPVLASANSSMPEVVGEGGLICSAEDTDIFVDNIIKLISDNDFYNELRLKAIKQAAKFSPEKQMPKLIDIINSLK